jgi:hypothetical protein
MESNSSSPTKRPKSVKLNAPEGTQTDQGSPTKGDTESNKSSSPSRSKRGIVISEKGVHIDHRDETINKVSGANVDTQHYYSKEETAAFSTHINNVLINDELCSRHLPFDIEQEDIFQKLGDGIVLMKLINLVYPGTIDEKKFNKQTNMSIYQKQENLNVVIAAANKIGAHIVNVGGQDIIAGR